MGKNVEILRLLCEPVDQAAINQLIEQTFKAALSYLHYNHKKISKIYIGEELSLEEVAISAITPLFCKDSQEHSIPIIKEAQSWQPPLRTENEALFFLNSVVGRRLEQHISYMLKEHDPFFAKILDSVNYLIKKNSYKRISYMGRKYIVNNNCDKINGKVIDQDLFYHLPVKLFKNKRTTIGEILSYLEHETDFTPAIPLNAFVLRLRNLSSNDYKLQTITDETIANFDAAEVVNLGFNAALLKLKDSYLEKGKFTKYEFDSFKKALRNIADDLKDGGINRGLYYYLDANMEQLNKHSYTDKYHSILEYLVKVMRNTIREHLVEGKQ